MCETEEDGEVKIAQYAGWAEGPKSDRALLIGLGMRGPMIHNGRQFEHCHVPDWDTMLVLIEFYPGFWHQAFTALDENGNQWNGIDRSFE